MANIIDERLKNYTTSTIEDEEHALKEILQEVALYGLASANFFDKAIFHGGSALRILYGLPRFSEDLDFLLKSPNPNFKWEPYMDAIVGTCKQYGIHPEITDKSRVNNVVKKMFLKDDSIGKIIDLSFVHHPGRKLAIKFEIDTNPPLGSNLDVKFLEFPLDYSIVAQDLSSSFAGKCHALLCREYIKGRDWYDFTWYVARKIVPNFVFLTNALEQQGPWANQKNIITPSWFVDAMQKKIKSIDWDKAASDVAPFLNVQDRKTLNLWGVDFFMDKLNKLDTIIMDTLIDEIEQLFTKIVKKSVISTFNPNIDVFMNESKIEVSIDYPMPIDDRQHRKSSKLRFVYSSEFLEDHKNIIADTPEDKILEIINMYDFNPPHSRDELQSECTYVIQTTCNVSVLPGPL